ncbi:MAG: cupin domain-containing protein [Desulfobacterales bacterium]|jgi:transcriptional regulator with XRE-family HTH domain
MKTEQIGRLIQNLMAQRKVSVQTLVERTGLEEKFVTDLLQDDVYPSVGPLLKIARAMGVRLGTILDDQISKDPLVIRRNQRKEKLSMLMEKESPTSMKFYSLGLGKTDRHMEPFFVELLPESSRKQQLSSHEGEEFIVVYSGRIEVVYGDDAYELEAGDSIYYNSIVPHYVSCRGRHTASIYAVLYIPE